MYEFDDDDNVYRPPNLTPEEVERETMRLEADARNIVRKIEFQSYQQSLPPPQNAAVHVLVQNMQEALDEKAVRGGDMFLFCAIRRGL